MKKIVNYIGLVVGAVALTACGESYLDQLPGNAIVTDKAITNYAEANTALNGVYDAMQKDAYYGADMYVSGEVRGDYMQALDAAKRTASFYEMSYNNQNAPVIWEYPYKLIRRANNVILAVEEGKAEKGGTEASVNVIKGQALTLRALAHFDLVRLYGKPYKTDNGASFGVPIEIVAAEPESQPVRATVAQVYDQVIADLTNAVTLLETSTAKTVSNGFVNVWAAKSLLARVYLYHGDDAQALALAKDVIDHSPYVLLTNAGYAAAWADGGNNTEMMFQIVHTTNDSPDRESFSYLLSEWGYADIIISKKLVDIMKANPNDVRGELMIKSVKETDISMFGESKMWLNKFPGTGGDPRINSTPIIRLSEVYLIAAEAAFKTGAAGLSDASLYLNAIAKRNPDLGTVTPTLETIMDQRGIELVGEGHRFYDLMRNNMASDRSSRWKYTFSVPESVSFTNTYFRALLPIPQVELDANENLKGQQNAGY